MLERLKRLLGLSARDDNGFYRLSFAQEGEDLLLLDLFADRGPGFYVDVGAHHPRKYSNTFALYDRGWSGINIDAMPGSMAAFRAARPRDINLEIAISDSRKTLTYYEFNEPALNGFDADAANARDGHLPTGAPAEARFRITGRRQIETVPLAEVLSKHVPSGRKIDLLSVDVEGLDLAVLSSNDWQRFRPTAVLAEDGEARTLDEVAGSPIARFLKSHGYVPLCRTRLTTIYARADRIEHGALGPRLTQG